jgi:hypothetical protein
VINNPPVCSFNPLHLITNQHLRPQNIPGRANDRAPVANPNIDLPATAPAPAPCADTQVDPQRVPASGDQPAPGPQSRVACMLTASADRPSTSSTLMLPRHLTSVLASTAALPVALVPGTAVSAQDSVPPPAWRTRLLAGIRKSKIYSDGTVWY